MSASPRCESVSESPDWLVRGGVATAEQLRRGAVEHSGLPGVFGFSVQRQRGKSITDLALVVRFPHAQISVATVEQVLAAASAQGYEGVQVVASPGREFHHTVVVPQPFPFELAAAVSRVFTVQPNPARTRTN